MRIGMRIFRFEIDDNIVVESTDVGTIGQSRSRLYRRSVWSIQTVRHWLEGGPHHFESKNTARPGILFVRFGEGKKAARARLWYGWGNAVSRVKWRRVCEGVPRAVRGVLAETVSRCVGSALAVAIAVREIGCGFANGCQAGEDAILIYGRTSSVRS